MRLGILGPLEVIGDDGGRCDPAAGRQRRLLLGLLVWRDQLVPVDRLIDIVWAGSPLPRDPLATLRTYVTRLRSVLEPDQIDREPRILTAGPHSYVLHLDGQELDAVRFEQDLARAAATAETDPADALRWFERALARWRGPALMDVADEHWAMPEAVRLEELRLTAVEQRLTCLIDTDAHEEAVGELERHVRRHPLRERPHGLLMVALDRSGRSADATEVFRAFRRRLADETGLDPSSDLLALHDRLLVSSASTTFAGTAVRGVWNELPSPRTGLIGREREVAELIDLLSEPALVTLTGVGGVGKTRLAVEVARRHRHDGGDALVVELASVTDGDDVVDAVFAALQLPSSARADALDGLVRLLRARRGLVIIDNCEHVIDAVAALVDALTRRCPELRVLTTSREPIGLDGERVYRVSSLAPAAGVALFRERAAAVTAGRGIGRDAEQLIAEICRRLDGIPLAIELAAARAAHMTLVEIAGQLEERFSLLTGGRKAIPRQQTLHATIDWSYELLSDDERQLFRAAAVFADGFDAESFAVVVGRSPGEVRDQLAPLVSRSLIDVATGHDRSRYRLLETMRLYGLERLRECGELAERRRAHARYYLTRAVAHEPRIDDLPPGGGERTMCRLRVDPVPGVTEVDLANHLAAVEWLAREGDVVAVGRLSARLATVLCYRGFLDPDRRYIGRDDVATALPDAAERALYLTASALHATYFGDFREVLHFAGDAMGIATDPGTRAAATALAAQGSLASDLERVPELVETALRDVPDDAYNTRLLLHGQRTLYLVMTGRLGEAVERLGEHARAGDVFAAAEQLLLLHVLGEDERVMQVPVPAGSVAEHTTLWSYRWPLARALAYAAGGRHADATSELLCAGEQIASSPVSLLDRDVLIGCAALAHHAGDHRRALQLLTAVGSKRRSPATKVLYDAYRSRVDDRIDPDDRRVIIEVASSLDPRDVLEQELSRLASAVAEGGSPHAGRRKSSPPMTVVLGE